MLGCSEFYYIATGTITSGNLWPFIVVIVWILLENKYLSLSQKPKAILVISAHWEETRHTVTTSPKPTLFYDYYGFPDETYKLEWRALGALDVAQRVRVLLEEAGIECGEDEKRGLDHGVFIPLKLAYPDAGIPGMHGFTHWEKEKFCFKLNFHKKLWKIHL